MNISTLISIWQNLQKNPLKVDILILLSSEEEARECYNYAKFFFSSELVLFLPSEDCLPYDRLSSSSSIICTRSCILTKLAQKRSPVILITCAINLLHKYIPKNLIEKQYFKIYTNQTISPFSLEKLLIKNNYVKTPVAIDAGDFSAKCDIIDIVTADCKGFRINFEWDRIHKIKLFDNESQISSDIVEEVEIYPASNLQLNDETIENFRNKYLTNFGISRMNEVIFEKISNNIKPEAVENFAPIFYKTNVDLVSYLDNPEIYLSQYAKNSIEEKYKEIEDFYHARITSVDFFPAFSPESLYYSPLIVNKLIGQNNILKKE
ncbi:MAG: hypothetical protein SFT68_02390, partial [Rickettsiaceae bacterium]|nr:hypothetical protein [Rickettsiaceae bacterium]